MSTAIMITSSPEDLKVLKTTMNIISFMKEMIVKGTSQFYLDYSSSVITPEDINALDIYYNNMYTFLCNPGMTQEEYSLYESSNT